MEDALTYVLNDTGAAAQKLWALAEANLHLLNGEKVQASTVPALCLVATNAAKADRSGRSYFDLVDKVEQHVRGAVYRERPRSRLFQVLPEDELDEEERAVMCVVEPRHSEGGAYMTKLGELFSAKISRHAQSLEWRDMLSEQEQISPSFEELVAQNRNSFMNFDSAELPLRDENVLGPGDESFFPLPMSEQRRNQLLLAKCSFEHGKLMSWSNRWGPRASDANADDDSIDMVLPTDAPLIGIECPTCLNDFNADTCEPRNFPCGHSLCLTCVDQLISMTPNHQRKTTIKCPTCRHCVTLSVPSRQSLPRNYSLLSFLQQNKPAAAKRTKSSAGARRRIPLMQSSINGPLFARLKLMSICLQAAERNLEGLAASPDYCVMSYRDVLLSTLQRLRDETKMLLVPEMEMSKYLRACLNARVKFCLESIELPPPTPAESVFASYVADPEVLIRKFSRLSPPWPVPQTFLAFVAAHNCNVKLMHVLCSDPQSAFFSGYRPPTSYREMLDADMKEKQPLLLREQAHPLSQMRCYCSYTALSLSIASHCLGAIDHTQESAKP